MLIALVDIADLLLSIVTWIIIVQVILSWLLAFNVLNTSSGGVRDVRRSRSTASPRRSTGRSGGCFRISAGSISRRWSILILIQVIKKLLAGVVTQYYCGG